MKILNKVCSVLLVVTFMAMPLRAYALPTGESVVTGPGCGSATFDRPDASTLNINQTGDKIIVNYDSFSIGATEAVNFTQPDASAIALNRVIGGDPSAILGRMSANGKIFLINQNGILFGSDCKIDTAGMIASSLDITNSDFLWGFYKFAGDGKSVVNQGAINAFGPGGYVALLGSTVENSGTIIANLGSIALASGSAVTVGLDPNNLIGILVTKGADGAAADQILNSGTLKSGDQVLLSAKSLSNLFANSVNTPGVIEGKTVTIDGDGNIDISGSITADAGAGYGFVKVDAGKNINAPGTIVAKGMEDHVVEMAESLMKSIDGTKTYSPQYSYGSKIELTANGDINVGNTSADYVKVETLGTNAGSIFDLGQIKAHLLVLAAKGDIGTRAKPIETNVDVLAGYSYGAGDIYINEVDSLELGFYLPVKIVDTFGKTLNGGLGMSLATADGRVFVQAGDDIIVNSIVAPKGGVYLQSTAGSIYAGKGWLLSDGNWLVYQYVPYPKIDVTGTAWAYMGELAPVTLTFANPSVSDNVNAGDYSYFSSLYGTIGVGTTASKDPIMSGGVNGYLAPGETAVTGVPNAPGFDPIYGYPEGYVVYNNGITTDQIYPAEAGTGLTIENPLRVVVAVGTNNKPAVRDGFTPVSGLTLQFGHPVTPPVNPDASGDLAAALNQYLRAYYEILKVYRVVAFEPATPTTFYGYRPITPTDSAAFDSMSLDEGFYQFLDNSISLKNALDPYFGSQEDEDLKKKK